MSCLKKTQQQQTPSQQQQQQKDEENEKQARSHVTIDQTHNIDKFIVGWYYFISNKKSIQETQASLNREEKQFPILSLVLVSNILPFLDNNGALSGDVSHSVGDTIKTIERATASLLNEVMKYKNASISTFKN
ncbi:hypothetical protein INT45_011490 [Circinella minor]|uniref:Uncharacterized protein n=1 Tax=Circinella minor TaxID=1195481 RepID=A0A8H7S2U6_9FUNG|nr:hypothetical protein INT45_011490 [Circinella minor]